MTGSTVTASTTSTSTITKTVVPRAKTTITNTQYSTSYLTTYIAPTNTITSTSTASVVTATATVAVYAQCQPSNLLGPGFPIHPNDNPNNPSEVITNVGNLPFTVHLTSALDCCNACAANANCAVAAFNDLPYQFEQICAFATTTPGQCSPSTASYPFEYASNNGGQAYIVSNGACGYFYDNGPDVTSQSET